MDIFLQARLHIVSMDGGDAPAQEKCRLGALRERGAPGRKKDQIESRRGRSRTRAGRKSIRPCARGRQVPDALLRARGSVLLTELVHAPGRVDDLLLARIERVAVR